MTTTLLRVAIQQPALPAYRVPIFAALANRPGLDVTVFYGNRAGSPPSIGDVPFHAERVDLREWQVRGHPVLWHAPQWRAAVPRAFDVVVLSWDAHYVSLLPGLLRARSNGVRTVLWGHGYSKRESPMRQRVRERIGRFADALLFYNDATAQRYRDAGWDAQRIFVAPNSIDQTPIQSARRHWLDHPDKLLAFQREHGLERGPTLLFVSRLDPENRVDLLINALPHLTAAFPHVQCVVIGKGDIEQEQLRRLAETQGVAQRIRFLGPIYNEMQLAPWFLSAAVFCYPVNIGLSILHAFGYGLPVVTSDHLAAQNPEIEALRDGENGLLFRHNDVNSLADALASIIGDPTLRTRTADEALRTVHTRFTLERMVDGMHRAIDPTAIERTAE